MSEENAILSKPARLEALRKTGLLDTEREEAFDRLTKLASRSLDAPVAMVTLVDDTRQFFKSACGLPEPLATTRMTPLSHSFCRHVVISSKRLIVGDLRQHSLVRDNPAVHEFGVSAYLGFPISTHDGHVIGSLCVLDFKVREWTEREIELMEDLAAVVDSEIELRLSRTLSKENAERLEQLLNSTEEGIYGIDEKGWCTFANEACARMLGYDGRHQLVGKNMHELIHHSHEDGSKFEEEDCPIYGAFLDGEAAHVTGEVFWKEDGTKFPVEYRSSPLTRAGALTGSVVLFSDITERIEVERRLEEAVETAERAKLRAEKSDRDKSRFLANMSHEIRTPMNAVIGFTELLSGHVETEKARRYLEVIRSSGSSLLNLINDILDLSKLESAEFEMNLQPCDIRELASRVRLLFSQSAQDKGLALRVNVGDEVPRLVTMDEERIRQVIVNLMGNAIKFTEKGTVALDIGCPEKGEGKVTLEIAVTDTGIGIDETDRRKIFKPFQQGAGAGQITEEGTGLGLSISRSIVKLCGGDLEVESNVGRGSMFTARFPGVAVEAGGQVGERVRREVDFDDFEPADILIVDDNMLNRELLGGYFEGTEHQIRFAANGADAVEITRIANPTLILMDIRMPGMSGNEARDILAADERHGATPVIAVTASSMTGQERRLRKAFNGYIRKPIRPQDLYDELEKFLQKRK